MYIFHWIVHKIHVYITSVKKKITKPFVGTMSQQEVSHFDFHIHFCIFTQSQFNQQAEISTRRDYAHYILPRTSNSFLSCSDSHHFQSSVDVFC